MTAAYLLRGRACEAYSEITLTLHPAAGESWPVTSVPGTSTGFSPSSAVFHVTKADCEPPVLTGLSASGMKALEDGRVRGCTESARWDGDRMESAPEWLRVLAFEVMGDIAAGQEASGSDITETPELPDGESEGRNGR